MKSDWRASVNELKKATKTFTDYLVTSFHTSWKRLGLQTSPLGILEAGEGGGGAGAFGEMCVTLKYPGYAPE